MTYRALLIGNSIFEADAGLNGLNAPVKDVARLHNALVNPATGMFDEGSVRLVTEATCDRILDELDDFFRSARRDDLALLYYSGHGVLDEHGQLYLCGRNTVSDRLLRTAVGNTRINEFIHDSACQHTVILLDCCSSGLFKGGAVETQLAGPGRYVVSSTRGAELANDAASPTGTSLFTEYLVEGLLGGARDEDGDGYIDLREIYDYTRAQLRANTTQVPHCRFDGDGAVSLARAATTLEQRAKAVEHAWNQPSFALAETYIAHRDVGPGEQLRDERIDILDFADQPLDLVAETDDEWIEAILSTSQLVVRLRPRTGANRAKVTVRDRTSGTTAAVRFLVRVLPALTPEAPTDPRLFDAPTSGRPTEPAGPPKGLVATVPAPPTYAGPATPAYADPARPPGHTGPPIPPASPRTSQPYRPPPPPPPPPPVRPNFAPGEGGPRSQPRRKVVVAAVALLGVAAAICVGLVIVRLVNRTASCPTQPLSAGTTQPYSAPGPVTVNGPARWANHSAEVDVQDFNPPGSTDLPNAPYMRIGIANRHPQSTMKAEAEATATAILRSPGYTNVKILSQRLCRFLGTDAADFEYTGVNAFGVQRHGIERRWIRDRTTRTLEYATPASQWSDASLKFFYGLANDTTDS
jgi:hypothetical protein